MCSVRAAFGSCFTGLACNIQKDGELPYPQMELFAYETWPADWTEFKKKVREWTDDKGVKHSASEIYYIPPQEWIKFRIPAWAQVIATRRSRMSKDGKMHDLIDSPLFQQHPLISECISYLKLT